MDSTSRRTSKPVDSINGGIQATSNLRCAASYGLQDRGETGPEAEDRQHYELVEHVGGDEAQIHCMDIVLGVEVEGDEDTRKKMNTWKRIEKNNQFKFF